MALFDFLKKEQPQIDPKLVEEFSKRAKKQELSPRVKEKARETLDLKNPPSLGEEMWKTWDKTVRPAEKVYEDWTEPIRKVLPQPETTEEAKNMGVIPFKDFRTDEYIRHRDGTLVTYDPFMLTGSLTNLAKKPAMGLFRKATNFLTSKLKREPTQLRSTVKNLLRERRSEIGRGMVDSDVFRKTIRNNLTKQERERLPFIIEGTDKGNSKLRSWAKTISDYYDEGFDYLAKNLDDVGFRENYVNHIWDIPKSKKNEVVSRFATKNPFTKKRRIPTLKEGMEEGLTPKTTDIVDLVEIYDNLKFNTVANTKFVKNLKTITDDAGESIIKRADDAPDDWITVDHPTINKQLTPAKVHPEIAKEVKTVLEKPFSGPGIKAYQGALAFTKKTALSVSFFHHWALTESAVSSGIGRKAFKLWNPRKIYRALKKGEYDTLQNIPLTKDAINSGLQLGAISDVQRSQVANMLGWAERRAKNIPALRSVTKGVRKANDLWDKALWDYYHNGLKLYAYEEGVKRALRKNTKKSSQEVKREVAQFVNDSFGGQVWEELLATPRMTQVAHWLLLSPDWTVSTLRQAASPFAKGARGKLGRKFWLRAGFYMYGGANVLNYVNTKREFGEGRFMWDNEPGRETYVFTGKRDDGSNNYIRPGKQYREAFEFLTKPLEKTGQKLSPIVRTAYEQLSGYSVTGWKTEWAGKEFWNPESLGARVKNLAGLLVPYSVSGVQRGGLTGVVMPSAKGFTWYRARDEFINTLKDGDRDRAMEIWKFALENNIDAKGAFGAAKQEYKSEQRMGRGEVEELIRELRNMPREEGLKKYRQLKEEGVINEQVEKQIRLILKQQQEIQKQKEAAGFTD